MVAFGSRGAVMAAIYEHTYENPWPRILAAHPATAFAKNVGIIIMHMSAVTGHFINLLLVIGKHAACHI